MHNIAVGSSNQIKVDAVRELITQYRSFSKSEVVSLDVSSGVREQPMSLDETITGAENRARRAFMCGMYTYGVGIESGLFEVIQRTQKYMNTCVCVFFDGHKYFMGMSSAFKFPPCVIQLVCREGLSVSKASQKAGLITDSQIAHKEGAIGLLTNGRLTRKEYIKQAVMTTLIQLEHPNLY